MSKQLKKSPNKMLTGVCGGVADYLNVDPTIVRLVFAAFSLFSGVGIVLYIAASIIIPDADTNDTIVDAEPDDSDYE